MTKLHIKAVLSDIDEALTAAYHEGYNDAITPHSGWNYKQAKAKLRAGIEGSINKLDEALDSAMKERP